MGGARFVTLDGVRGFVGFAFGVPATPFAPFGVLGLSIASISRLGDAGAWPELSEESVLLRESILVSISDFSFSNAFSVSLLDCFRGRAWGASCALFCRLARGVRFSGNPSHAASSSESEPLSKEFSLSDPSLSQWRFSKSLPPAVCWRIQSSVMPCLTRRARFAKTAAAPLIEDEGGCRCESSSGGTGRRKGVRSSRW